MECLQEVCKILIRRKGINHMDPAFTEVCFILAFIAAMWVFTMIFLWCEQRRNNALRQNNPAGDHVIFPDTFDFRGISSRDMEVV